MRRTALVAGLASCAIFIGVNEGHASAATDTAALEHITSQGTPRVLQSLSLLGVSSQPEVTEKTEDTDKKDQEDTKDNDKAKESKKITKHTVEENETLADIAKLHKTTWKRLFYKNTDIESPDIINPGDVIVIPQENEKLEARALPQATLRIESRTTSQTQSRSTRSSSNTASTTIQSTRQVARSTSAGNTYSRGYCTWYAKNMRPDIPNGLGNANTWASRARAMGLAVGSKPAVGAVAQERAITHVAIVESVNADGTVTVSEMNYRGFGVVSRRTAPASAFIYIY